MSKHERRFAVEIDLISGNSSKTLNENKITHRKVKIEDKTKERKL